SGHVDSIRCHPRPLRTVATLTYCSYATQGKVFMFHPFPMNIVVITNTSVIEH
ncbi:hypothetical protein GBAR_LOCUS16569, partial [Geodia barretti]